jgi:hypothetical protein
MPRLYTRYKFKGRKQYFFSKTMATIVERRDDTEGGLGAVGIIAIIVLVLLVAFFAFRWTAGRTGSTGSTGVNVSGSANGGTGAY